jgi:tRNA(fMet)-specific endonuclease VapC
MPYLIDSDWTIDLLIDLLKEVPTAVNLLESLAGEGMYISIVTYMEAFQGTFRDPNPSLTRAELRDLIQRVPILEFDLPVAERCASIRESVRGGAVRANRRAHDLMIAATAIEHSLTLVTRNVDDFSDIPGLLLHNA